MEDTLQALGRILLNGLPTSFLFILLHFYLKYVFFKPLEKARAQRWALTEGARNDAEAHLKAAEARVAEYRVALQKARGEIYAGQEEVHQKARAAQEAQLGEARKKTDLQFAEARKQIAREADSARDTLATDSDAVANQIVDAVLSRSAA